MITTNFSLRRRGGSGGGGEEEEKRKRRKKIKYSATLIDYTNLLFLNGLTLSGVLLRGASSQIHIPAGKEA